MIKQGLRDQIKHRLASLVDQQRDEKSKAICDHLLKTDEFHDASVVMAFLSMPHEVDTTPIILHAWQQNKTVAVPKVSWEQRHMIPVEIKSLETGITTGTNGLRNPTAATPVSVEEIDIVLTPGLAFDRSGNRLGRGGAYYDKFFKSEKLKSLRWALAFDIQIVDSVPHDETDFPVDAIVTENGIHFCR